MSKVELRYIEKKANEYFENLFKITDIELKKPLLGEERDISCRLISCQELKDEVDKDNIKVSDIDVMENQKETSDTHLHFNDVLAGVEDTCLNKKIKHIFDFIISLRGKDGIIFIREPFNVKQSNGLLKISFRITLRNYYAKSSTLQN